MAKYIVQHRRATAAQWAETDTLIPSEGEIVIEIDEVNSLHKLKIGDGIHTYAELAYLMAGDEIITQVLAGARPRIVTVELTSNWTKNTDDTYSQVVALANITKHSRVDLQPSADMLAEFKQLGLVFVTENNGGTITVNSVGNMPSKAYSVQATVVETECDGKDVVVGIPIGTPVAQSDWNQTDDTKVDFIKNKPEILTEENVLNLIEEHGGDQQVQSDWSQTNASEVDFIKNKPTFATVATSGSYNDLSDKPSFATETFVQEKIAEAQLSSSDIDLSEYAKKEDVPSTTDDIDAGTKDIWIFDCGTSTEVI